MMAPDGGRCKQKLVSEKTGEEVNRKDLRKGIELGGSLTAIEEADLKAIAPKSEKTIQISEFVPAETLDPIFFNASYYVAPGAAGEKAYTLLYHALKDSGKYGVAKATMFGGESVVAIRAYRGGLVLHRLFYESEVRAAREFRADTSTLSDKEVKMANAVVEMMSAEAFDPAKFQDEYTDTLRALVQAKIAGLKLEPGEEPHTAPDILELLRQSVEQAKPASPSLTPMLDSILSGMREAA
jgi:DNA end-binding protein Ku